MTDCSAPQRHTWTQATSSYSSFHEISRVLLDFWHLPSNKQRNRKMRLWSACICSLHILLARIGSRDPTGLQGGWEMWPLVCPSWAQLELWHYISWEWIWEDKKQYARGGQLWWETAGASHCMVTDQGEQRKSGHQSWSVSPVLLGPEPSVEGPWSEILQGWRLQIFIPLSRLLRSFSVDPLRWKWLVY